MILQVYSVSGLNCPDFNIVSVVLKGKSYGCGSHVNMNTSFVLLAGGSHVNLTVDGESGVATKFSGES